MARIKGVDVPDNKKIKISLTHIYGVGKKLAETILANASVDMEKKTKDLTEDELARIRKELDNHTVEGDLRREVAISIKMLKEIGCYRGKRHIKRLPVRGQRTNRNAITARGGKRQVVANKKK